MKTRPRKTRLWWLLLPAALLGLAIAAILLTGGSKSEKEAYRLCEEARAHFEKDEYEPTIAKVSRALELTGGGKQTFTVNASLYDGSAWHLRGQAREALGHSELALADYRTAVTQGVAYLKSYVFNSDPNPGGKAEWFRTLSRFHNSLGRVYAAAGLNEDALGEFKEAIGAALGTVERVDVTDRLLADAFTGEAGKRRAFAKVAGAYYYNVAQIEERLGISSSARSVAEQLGYDSALTVSNAPVGTH
jgi:tetratricopeptide (TPR) repeat protein